MFGNYLKVALRNLSRNILFVIINITALGLALSICIVAYLNGKYDSDWDKNHLKAEHIYKINFIREIQGSQQPYGATPIPVASMIEENYSGVEKVIRFTGSYSPLKVGLNNFTKSIAYADPAFMDVFTVPVIKGSARALDDKQNILISETIASIYFGDEDPLGRVMSIFNDRGTEFTFTVGGVFMDNPLNSSFSYEVLTQMENFMDMREVDPLNWGRWIAATFLYIPNPGQRETVEHLLQEIVPVHNQARKDFQISGFRLQPLLDVGHDSWDVLSDWSVRRSFHPAAVKAPPFMAFLLLLIACFNFTNTAIASSSRRLKEIGVRKVAGGHRKQIIQQFMTENFILTFLGLLLALLFARYFVRLYSSMWEYMDLEYSLVDNPHLVIFLVVLLIITTLFAGAYPSFYISRFNPVYIFQDKLKIGGRNIMSVILLTLQVGISVQALNSGVLFTQNARYQGNIYLGYDKDHVIAMELPSREYYVAFLDILKTNPLIRSVGESSHHIGHGNYARSMRFNDIEGNVGMLNIGENYLETMGLNLKEGRTFSRENEKTDRENAIIVNEKFISEFGIEDPIGQRVVMSDSIPLYIVGVAGDFYPYGVWNEIEPAAFRRAAEESLWYLVVKTETSNLKEVNLFMEETWKEMIPSHPYNGFFQDELMEEGRQINKNIKDIYLFLAFIALILSAMGLYTLVSLSVIRRTKEVGVRKVVGSSISKVILILSRPYAVIIGIASLIGLTAGHYSGLAIMKSIWEVHADPTVLTYVLPVLIMVLISLISIGWKVYQAASRNPTESLRYE